MNNDIKEIIDYLKNENAYNIGQGDLEITLYKYEVDKLLDYINNLQEENENLKDYLDIFKLSNKTKQETIDDFRKRIDKAVEYINENSAFMNDDEWEVFNKKELLNILNGGE